MLETDAEQMTPKLHKIFAKWGVKLCLDRSRSEKMFSPAFGLRLLSSIIAFTRFSSRYPVKWDVPPDMKFYPKTEPCLKHIRDRTNRSP